MLALELPLWAPEYRPGLQKTCNSTRHTVKTKENGAAEDAISAKKYSWDIVDEIHTDNEARIRAIQ